MTRQEVRQALNPDVPAHARALENIRQFEQRGICRYPNEDVDVWMGAREALRVEAA